MRHWIAAIAFAVPAFAVPLSASVAAVKEEPVTYKSDDTTMKGFVVYDDASSAKRPGVLVVHEWWGITKHTRDEARKLARAGYTAFVVDMFGDGRTADNPKDASALAGAVRKDPKVQLARFNAARDQLAKHATVDASRIGAIGFCFGGSVVLDAARGGSNLAGVAAFHAGLDAAGAAAAPGKVKSRVLVLNGADAFKKEMEAAKVNYRYVTYPGAVHAFTNPEATDKGKQFNLPLVYNPEVDKQSKAEMGKFFGEVFKR